VVKESPVRRVVRIPARGGVYLKHDRFRGLGASPSRAIAGPGRRDTARGRVQGAYGAGWPRRAAARRVLESFLVTAGIDGAEPLDALLREERLPPAGRARGRWRRQVARALGEVVAKFHAGGFWHRDLHPGNFLAQPFGDAGPAIMLIDLHKARRPANPGPEH
jgi:hypothetical protein